MPSESCDFCNCLGGQSISVPGLWDTQLKKHPWKVEKYTINCYPASPGGNCQPEDLIWRSVCGLLVNSYGVARGGGEVLPVHWSLWCRRDLWCETAPALERANNAGSLLLWSG